MNGTPRLRSAYPSTPQQSNRSPRQSDVSAATGSSASKSPRLPDIGTLQQRSTPEETPPLIPFEVIDAPSQRLYVFGAWLLLHLWRLYDYYNLTVDEVESIWLFMKWISIDLAFLYTLESMRIPWLDFRPTTLIVLFAGHALLDGLLMFRIPIPFNAWLVAFVRYLYDRELAVSETYVKTSKVVHNPSLLLGRQIIHVLPEGSAVLNPDKTPFCISTSKFASSSVTLPIQINQTNPVSIELVRFDLDTSENETITISASQAKKLHKDATKGLSGNPADPLVLRYPVKKTGLYRLSRVVDETKLDVHRRASEALVVACPSAKISSTGHDRCRGDLSDLTIEVEGTPPLRIKYRRADDAQPKPDVSDVSYQSIQPEDFNSPLMRQQGLGQLIQKDQEDFSWARSYRIRVPLNETLSLSGKWFYSIEEVTDACNNVVAYAAEDDSNAPKARDLKSRAELTVYERPRLSIQGYDVQRPIRIASGHSVEMPLKYTSTGRGPISNAEHTLSYLFSSADSLTSSGGHGNSAAVVEITAKPSGKQPMVKEAGLYSLRSVSTKFCGGEVLEPTSFVLVNPPEPDMEISSEQISDKCAGNLIGLRVNLDFVGTPPFFVKYLIHQEGHRTSDRPVTREFDGLRGSIEFTPREAASYTYTFQEISDAVYKPVSLKSKNLILKQDVKPSVFASFSDRSPRARTCIDQPAKFEVTFQGEGPWTLEYELVHAGKRSKRKVSNIERDKLVIDTGPLTSGGEHSLVLTSVIDKAGCKEALEKSAEILVLHRPKASFGTVEGKRSIRTLEGKSIEIPLRLSGEGPWTVEYEHQRNGKTTSDEKNTSNKNDFIRVREPGTYKITGLSDSVCPGTVEEESSFEISSIERPGVTVTQSPLLESTEDGFARKDVCEGEEDALDVFFHGRPPYDVKYRERIKPDRGAESLKNKEMHVPLNSAQIKMDTMQAGLHEYTFLELGDYNYDHDSKKHKSLVIRQRVNPRPSAVFGSPGKVYSFCQSQTAHEHEDTDPIPITLSGKAPFTVEVDIRRNSKAARPDTITFPNIPGNTHNIRIPRRYLSAGNSALTIRRVRDSRGCERVVDPSLASRVQISVHDLPSIAPNEDRMHYCVGDRIAFSLSGMPPYTIHYDFAGQVKKVSETTHSFRRLAEKPGNFTVFGLQDSGSNCLRSLSISKFIHPLPSAMVGQGKEQVVDIHAGGETDMHFYFTGTPPFEFTYQRSENTGKGSAGGGAAGGSKAKRGGVLETKTVISHDRSYTIKARDEGAYEIVAVRDRYCSVARQGREIVREPGQVNLLLEA